MASFKKYNLCLVVLSYDCLIKKNFCDGLKPLSVTNMPMTVNVLVGVISLSKSLHFQLHTSIYNQTTFFFFLEKLAPKLHKKW